MLDQLNAITVWILAMAQISHIRHLERFADLESQGQQSRPSHR